MLKTAISITLALAPTAAIAQAQDDLWPKYGKQLSAEGISEPMLRAAMLWTEGQYHIGVCRKFVKKADLSFWRNWWKDTPIERSTMGAQILQAGNEGYDEGIRDAKQRNFTAVQCQRLLDRWLADLKATLP